MKKLQFIVTLSLLFLLIVSTTFAVIIVPNSSLVNNKVKIALVNEDLGYTYNSINRNMGNNFVNKIIKNEDYDITITSRNDAIKSINDGLYDLALIIPQNFSDDIMTYDSLDPTTASVEYYVNPDSSKIDYLSSFLEKSNVEKFINSYVNEVLTKEVMSVLNGVKASEAETVDAQVDYQVNFDDNITSPFQDSMSGLNSTLTSILAQQSQIESQGVYFNSYLNSLDRVIGNTEDVKSDSYEHNEVYVENTTQLDEVYTFFGEVNSDFSGVKENYDSDLQNTNPLEEMINTVKDVTVQMELEKIELKNNIIVNLEFKQELQEAFKLKLAEKNTLGEFLDIGDIHAELEKDIGGSALSEELKDVKKSQLYSLSIELESVEKEINKLINSYGDKEKENTYFKNTIVSNCTEIVKFNPNISYTSTIGSLRVSRINNMCNALTDIKYSASNTLFPPDTTQYIDPTYGYYEVINTAYIGIYGSTDIDFEEKINSGQFQIPNNNRAYINPILSKSLEYPIEITKQSIISETEVVNKLNEFTKESYVYNETADCNNDYKACYVDGIGSLPELVMSLTTREEEIVGTNLGLFEFVDRNNQLFGTHQITFNEFNQTYIDQQNAYVVINDDMQILIDELNSLLDTTSDVVAFNEEVTQNGLEIIDTTESRYKINEDNQILVLESQETFNLLVTDRQEFLDDLNSKYSNVLLGSIENQKFFDNYSNPVDFKNDGSIFNFGSIVPFLIIFLIAMFSLLIGYLFNYFDPESNKVNEHREINKYYYNKKQFLNVLLTGLISSFTVAYIGVNAISITNSTAIVWFVVVISIGTTFSLLFYMLLNRLKTIGFMIIGLLILLFIATSGVLDLSFQSNFVQFLTLINPMTYFETIIRDVINDKTINIILFLLVLLVLSGSSSALILTTNSYNKLVNDEKDY